MTDKQITISQAIEKLRQWLEEKDYERVRLGVNEILNIDPNNQEAKQILQQCDERSKKPPLETKEEIKFPETPAQKQKADTEMPLETPMPDMLHPDEESHNKAGHVLGYLVKKILTILLIMAAIGGLGYGGFRGYNYYTSLNNEEIPTETKDTEEETVSVAKANNEKRNKDLIILQNAIEAYYADNGKYPEAENIEKTLLDGYIEKILVDPLHGEKDQNGIEYGYIYAVYDVDNAERQDYVISANFENNEKENNIWSPNNNYEAFENFRNTSKENVKLLDETIEKTPKKKIKRK